MPAFALVGPPPLLTVRLLRLPQCSPTARDAPKDIYRTRSFGTVLEPRYIFGADSLDQ
jgi:hypothetical protein